MIGFIKDISKYKEIEYEIEQVYLKEQELSMRLENIHEEEQKLIFREIHDEFGRALTILKIDLAWLKDELPSKARGYQRKI